MKGTTEFQVGRVLCGADFSELSDLALKYAAAGAKAYGAELTVFHAEYFDLPTYFTAAEVEQLTVQIKGLRREVGDLLRQHVQTVLGPLANEISIAYAVKETRPVDGVLAMANEAKADLIVLGTHGRRGASRVWLGSVVEGVARQAEVPLFVVRQKEHDFIDASQPRVAPHLKSILCAVGGDESGRAAMRVAASIAKRFQALLVPVCVVGSTNGTSLPAADADLRSWVEATFETECLVKPIDREHHPAEAILAMAADRKADLIVLGRQPRAHLWDWFFGGVTELVLRHAPAPVLMVPPRVS
jgi:nucleotide-binding universal stress UspA family protein